MLGRTFAASILYICFSHYFSASAAPATARAPDGPIVIDHGGTYRGSWFSDDPSTATVVVRTAQAVIIEDSVIRGRGVLVRTAVDHTRITLRNVRAEGMNPNITGRTPGRFFDGDNCDNLLIENCDLTHTAGIKVTGFGGNREAGDTLRIQRNLVRNIDGRRSDGHAGWLDFNLRKPLAGGRPEAGFEEDTHFVILDRVRGVPGIDISWNQVINDPGESRVEDIINTYLSSGTTTSPIRIHDNYLRGAYTVRPWQADSRDEKYSSDWHYSGGGILLGDGNPASPEDAAAFVEAFDNQVVSTTNYGIAIASGHDLCFHDNRIISCGRLPDGRTISGQNVGAYIWDIHHGSEKTPPTFFANAGRDNLVGWIARDSRNDWWHPDSSAWTANRHWPGELTVETENGEWRRWEQKTMAAHVMIGAPRLSN